MGKIKRERQKFHIVAENKDVTRITQEKSKYKPLQLNAVENIFAGIQIQLDDINKFEDVPKTESPENVEKSSSSTKESSSHKIIISNNSNKLQKPLTKKEKLVLKHQKLMEKLDVTQKARRLQGQKKKQKRNLENNQQTLLNIKSDVRPMLTPSAVKPSKKFENGKNHQKNIFAIPEFNDNLPSLSSVFNSRPNQKLIEEKVSKKSKSIANNFVNNYNFLKKAMQNKKLKK